MKLLRSVLPVLLVLFITVTIYANIRGPKNKRTGAPGEQICIASKCHVGHDLNSGPGTLTITGIPDTYTPGDAYPITISLQQRGQHRWGFELTAINADSAEAGTITKYDHGLLQVDQDKVWGKTRFYLKHTRKGTYRKEKNGPVEWHFTWQAPKTNEGLVKFYIAANAGNGNREPTGDYIYQTEITSNPPIADAEDDTTKASEASNHPM